MIRFPFAVVVSDGVVMRRLHGPAFGADLPALEAIVSRALAPLDATRPQAIAPPRPPKPAISPTMVQAEIAQAQGYAGDPCDTCQQFKLKRAGHCMVCDACGTTTGCS